MIDYEAQQVFCLSLSCLKSALLILVHHACIQNKAILERRLPDALKLAIAHKIENNLFSKVILGTVSSSFYEGCNA